VIVLQVGLVVAFVAVRRDWAPVPRRADVPDDVEPLDRIALALALLLFLVYVGIEAGVGGWGFTLLTDGRGMGDAGAGVWMSAYWLSLTVGRLVLGLAGHRRRPEAVLSGSVAVAVLACAFLWLDPGSAGALAVVPLGLALASIFPVLVALTPARLGAHRAARALGAQIAASSVGGVAIPAAMGVAAQAWGTDVLPALFSASAVGLAGLHVAALRRHAA
jgi:fucose permease